MPRRTLADMLGVYRRDGRVVFGRAPYITAEQWSRIEHPGPILRVLQFLGLAYASDHTRPRALRPTGRRGHAP